jgi:hypothetical protein
MSDGSWPMRTKDGFKLVHLKGSQVRGWSVYEGESLVGWFADETAATETAHEILRTRPNPFVGREPTPDPQERDGR